MSWLMRFDIIDLPYGAYGEGGDCSIVRRWLPIQPYQKRK